MKKLMMAVAVVACALGVQAASVDWLFTEQVKHTNTYTDLSSYTAYLFTDAAYQSMIGNVSDGKLDKSFFAGYVDQTGIQVKTAATATTFNIGSTAYRTTDSSLTDGTYWIVIADLEGGDAFSRSFAATAYDETASPVPSHTTASWSITKVGAPLSESNAAFEIVPEPTSGLLMLLGMGALALRRRRA